MRYNLENLEQLKFYLLDEQERLDKCEDEFTKKLLSNRVAMWKRLITEIEAEPKKENANANTNSVSRTHSTSS